LANFVKYVTILYEREEVDIIITGDTLTIKGETKSEEVKPKQIKVKAKGVIEGKK